MRWAWLWAWLWVGTAVAADVKPVHGIAMHGSPKYAANFQHFDYVNPDAPKGGDLRMATLGGFDSMNPFIVRGDPAAGLNYLFDTLLTSSADEPFSEYGLLAESIEMPPDRSWVVFTLRREARFHDGTPVLASDVVWTFNTLKDKGAPQYRLYYAGVANVEAEGERRVKFTFSGKDNRELPLIVGQMPVLPEHAWTGKDFAAPSLDIPIGSGPYRVQSMDAGRRITLVRDTAYWGRDLPVNRGFYNFATIRYDYYRDTTVAVEAFKAGEFDVRAENQSKTWATAYKFPAVDDGRVILREFPHGLPSGMQGFVFNLRRPLFADRRVREALGMVFDFEWANRNLFYGAYKRTRSYFDNSELAARGLPEGDELKELEPFRTQLPTEVFTKEYQPVASDGTGNVRPQLRKAMDLLQSAGWKVVDGKLVDGDGRPFAFEVLIDNASSAAWERIGLPYVRNLRRLGIDASLRVVDNSQYKNRTDSFDYDMIVDVFGASLSPGNELRGYFGSKAAASEGSQNTVGIKDPVVDALAERVVSAPDRTSLVTRVRALDRVLQWGFYVVPHWHISVSRVAYWNRFGMPKTVPLHGVQLNAWWFDADASRRTGGGKH